LQSVYSRVVGFPGSFVDIPTTVPGEGDPGKLTFTLHWPESPDVPEHWLGHNVEVEITWDKPGDEPLGTKPAS
jgi:hypothetical protein